MSNLNRIIICIGLLVLLFPLFMSRKGRKLPEHLVIGYAQDYETDIKIVEAVEQGLNVVIWFSCNLKSQNGKPIIETKIDFDELKQRTKEIKDKGYDVTHLISIGGWGYPHPDLTHSFEEYFQAWEDLNQNLSTDGFEGFDGFDWDIEGHSDLDNPGNEFKIETLDLMGKLSQKAKENQYLVTMAPGESTLDSSNNNFSLSLKFIHPEWVGKAPSNFLYHGRNAYSYLLKKYEFSTENVKTFDFISVQLYESYAHALFKYRFEGARFATILKDNIERYKNGWLVKFTQEPKTGLQDSIVKVEPERLVIGLANTWNSPKILLVSKPEIFEAYNYIRYFNLDVRGFMYWNIYQDTTSVSMANTFYRLFN